MEDKAAKIIFIASVAVLGASLFFFWGYATREKGTWPRAVIEDGRAVARSLRQYGSIVPESLLHQAPDDAAPVRFLVHDPAQMQVGWYLVMGWDHERRAYRVWLFDERGTQHHAWPINYRALDADGPLNGSDVPHAVLAMPDASLILNFDEGDVMARIDHCGEPIWVRPGVFHHSFDRDSDGTVWTWLARGTPYAHHHSLLRFDPETGETVEEIRLVEDIIQRDVGAEVVLGTRADFPFRHFDRTPKDRGEEDLFHPNDIEVLSVADAAAFPDFAAGDLLISLRNINLVAVLDRQSHRLKWWSHGPWIRQHDPDFLPDGWISVYNNNTGRGRSEIVKIHPGTRRLTSDLHDGNARFYAPWMGKHQYLPGGNVLIVAPSEGRVLVTSPRGDLVFEFNNLVPRLPGVRALVSDALWLPPDHFSTVPTCAKAAE